MHVLEDYSIFIMMLIVVGIASNGLGIVPIILNMMDSRCYFRE
jgi:hypothetical protein